MATPSNIILIPKPDRRAYDPQRSLDRNLLIKAQVRHFEEAERNLPPELQTGISVESIRTEGEASQYIRKVTEAIHKNGGRIGKVERAT